MPSLSRCLLTLLVVGLWGPGASHAAEAPQMQICTGDDDAYPWQMNERPGLLMHLMQMVEQRVGGRFTITAKPWKRCLLELRSGDVHAAFKSSYSPERAAEGAVFPMLGDRPDAAKRMLMDSYSLFRLKGSHVEWDGRQLRADGVIGAQTGFSIVAQLRALGATVDDGTRLAPVSLQKLLAGRVVAVALQTQEGDTRLAQNPEFAARIERVQPVLTEKPYFLVYSRQFFAQHEDHARAIWDAIALARESAEFRQLVRDFK